MHTYTQIARTFRTKINLINLYFLKTFTLCDEWEMHETQGYRHYHVIYIYIYLHSQKKSSKVSPNGLFILFYLSYLFILFYLFVLSNSFIFFYFIQLIYLFIISGHKHTG